MSRIYRFVVIFLIMLFAIVEHLLVSAFVDPDMALFDLGQQATAFAGATRTQLWYEIGAIWIPLMAVGIAITWALVMEFRQQRTTRVVRRRP